MPSRSRRRPRRWRPASASSVMASYPSLSTSRTSPPYKRRRPGSSSPEERTSKGEFAQRTAVALAERLGTPLIDFPGGHAGFVSESKEFAVILSRTLAWRG